MVGNTGGGMDPTNLSTKRQRIAELARRKPGTALFLLHHVIDLEWMRKAYWLTRKDGATGIDGVTAKQYEANLTANLLDLLDRIKSGRYQAPPVRRTYIPKADGSQRPLGIPTFEDSHLRAGLLTLLLRLSAATLGTYGVARSARRHHLAKTALGAGCRYTQVFRLNSACATAGVSRPTSNGWRDPTDDRQVAQSRSPGRWATAPCV